MRTILLPIIFYLGLALLFTHELDAIMGTEWRLLYFLRNLTDESAYPLFLWLHVPAFFLIMWFSQHANERIRSGFRLGIATFLVIHAVLHARLSVVSTAYDFIGISSNALIYGSGCLGIAYLVLSYLNRPTKVQR